MQEQLNSDAYPAMTFEERLGLLLDRERTEAPRRSKWNFPQILEQWGFPPNLQ